MSSGVCFLSRLVDCFPTPFGPVTLEGHIYCPSESSGVAYLCLDYPTTSDDIVWSCNVNSDFSVIDRLVELIEALVATPTDVEMGVAFMAAFSLPVICYLSAWALSKVINFF